MAQSNYVLYTVSLVYISRLSGNTKLILVFAPNASPIKTPLTITC